MSNCLQSTTQPSTEQFWDTIALFNPVKVHQKVSKLQISAFFVFQRGRFLYMSHSQMLGKFEYGLPAKF